MARITSLHVYPVKGCRGIDVADALITPTGLEWDRRWMIVRPDGEFITQREHPLLATIAVTVGKGKLILQADGQAPLVVDADHSGATRRVTIWDDACDATDAGIAAAAWLGQALGEDLSLVRIDLRAPRLANPKYTGTTPQPVSFTDGYPVLMISQESLADLNSRLPEPIPMARFRPNVVIGGVAPYAEDAMSLFRFGPVVLRGVKLCARCPVTTTDQLTGARDAHQQPLRTLGKYRHDYALRGVVFGQNCTLHAGVGEGRAVGAALANEPKQV
jgi:uncharacterized protein YcbX